MGDASVTGAFVPVGAFQLSESGGPGGYAPSVWTCSGNATPVTPGGAVTIGLGENVTCSITNTDQPATITLQKIVDVGASRSGKVPADWTVTATPVAIPGQADDLGQR